MNLKLIAIAAIALSPAVVLGQSRTHIRVSKDGSHTSTSATNGDVYTAPTPAPAAEPAPAPAAEPAPAPEPMPAPAASTTTTTDSSSMQYGTGAAAPTPTHSQQADSAAAMSNMSTDSSSMNGMKTDSSSMNGMKTDTPVDTVRVPRSNLNVSPIDSVRMGIPSTPAMQKADSMKVIDSTTKAPPR